MYNFSFVLQGDRTEEVQVANNSLVEAVNKIHRNTGIVSYAVQKIDSATAFLRIAKNEGVDIPEGFLSFLTQKNFGGIETGGFFYAPASTRFHGAYDGGLFDHSLRVYERLKDLTRNNHSQWGRKESPFIIGFFHDLCKVDSYRKLQVAPTVTFAWNDAASDHRHAVKSLDIIERYMDMTEEERDCILFHMGPYTSKNATWDETSKLYADYDAAVCRHENVLWTHMADMLASKIDKT